MINIFISVNYKTIDYSRHHAILAICLLELWWTNAKLETLSNYLSIFWHFISLSIQITLWKFEGNQNFCRTIFANCYLGHRNTSAVCFSYFYISLKYVVGIYLTICVLCIVLLYWWYVQLCSTHQIERPRIMRPMRLLIFFLFSYGGGTNSLRCMYVTFSNRRGTFCGFLSFAQGQEFCFYVSRAHSASCQKCVRRAHNDYDCKYQSNYIKWICDDFNRVFISFVH